MIPISVPTQFTADSLDRTLTQVLHGPSNPLKISSSLQCRSLISSSSYLQLILTWAQISPSAEVTFTIRSPADIEFLPLAAETLVPLLLSKKVYLEDLRTGLTSELNTTHFKQRGLDLFSQLEGGRPVQQNLFEADEVEVGSLPRKGARVHLIAADSYGDHSQPNWFYKGPPESRRLRGPDDFISLTRSTVSLIQKNLSSRFGKWIEDLTTPFGEMLFELIDNTHNWGRHGLKQQVIPSLRGVIFDIRHEQPNSNASLSDVANDLPPLRDFITFHRESGKYPMLGLMEISVFDGGVGLSARELQSRGIENPTVQDELDAAIICFKKWATSSKITGRGLGLNKVIEITSLSKGFIRLRTGRLSLCKDYANHPVQDPHREIDWEEFSLAEDIHLNPSTPHPKAAGTFFSIILPFNCSSTP